MSIERFREENYFLSNMYPLTNWVVAECGILVPTSEHDYQVSRFVSIEHQLAVAEARDPDGDRHGIASKELAHKLLDEGAEQLPDWDLIKPGKMLAALLRKFDANKDIADKLVATGNQELVEGNNWEDRFWGVDPIGSRNGKNWLGKLLMVVREDVATKLDL